MNLGKKIICLIIPLFTILGCSESNVVKIMVDDISSVCDISYFRGIKADMYYKDLVAVVGEPNEIYQRERKDEDDDYNPVYYYQEGKIMCYWTGRKKDPIGVIEYTPYLNSNIRIDDFIESSYQYNINSETKKVAVFKGDTLYYLVYLDNLKIKKIEYWKVKKKMFNIADKYD